MDSRRSYENFFKYGKLRKRYYLYMLVGGLGIASVFGGMMLSHLREIQTAVGQAGLASEPVLAVSDQLFSTAMLFFFSFLVYTVIATVLIMYLEGRVGGASIAIIDVLEQYKHGNYTHGRELRVGDELQPIMDAVKSLGKSLHEKK